MDNKNRSNLGSPHQNRQPCRLGDLDAWFRQEAAAVTDGAICRVVVSVYEQLGSFISWPQRSLLLWEGCDRSNKYHRYPASLVPIAKRLGVRLDGRTNGPAIAAFCVAEGRRPPRFGSNNAWSVHHLYSGKFPYPGRQATLHAAHSGLHCTQSAGLVAIHPIADQMCDEYPFFAWLLRAMAFQKFRYDPDEVFSADKHDEYGFAGGECLVLAWNEGP
jgi:hypothetical protein